MEPPNSPNFNSDNSDEKMNLSTNQTEKNMKNEDDRISDLPESVIHHIISLLDLKLAIQTSVLSKKWRYVWKSLPFLDFNCNRFISKKMERAEGFKEFVDQVLKLRYSSCSIQRFRLSCYRLHDFLDIKSRLDSWVLTALASNVQELYLNVFLDPEFGFPDCLFTCKSLRVLELKSYGYLLKLNLPDSMSLPRLKTLVLHYALLEGDDIPNKIFSSCPVLESLAITNCEFQQTNLDISSLKLKHLELGNSDDYPEIEIEKYSVKLCAPNLISFHCKDFMSKNYSVENLSALEKAEIDMRVYGESRLRRIGDRARRIYAQRMMKFLSALHNVKDLKLSARFLKVVSGAPAMLGNTLIMFYNLRSLKLETWLSRDCINAITDLLKISPYIESLFVEIEKDHDKMHPVNPYLHEDHDNMHPMNSYMDEVSSATIEDYQDAGVSSQYAMHHLKFVEIRGIQGCHNELMFLEILLKHSIVLENLVLHTSQEQTPHGEEQLGNFSMQLLTLPRASPSVGLLML